MTIKERMVRELFEFTHGLFLIPFITTVLIMVGILGVAFNPSMLLLSFAGVAFLGLMMVVRDECAKAARRLGIYEELFDKLYEED